MRRLKLCLLQRKNSYYAANGIANLGHITVLAPPLQFEKTKSIQQLFDWQPFMSDSRV